MLGRAVVTSGGAVGLAQAKLSAARDVGDVVDLTERSHGADDSLGQHQTSKLDASGREVKRN